QSLQIYLSKTIPSRADPVIAPAAAPAEAAANLPSNPPTTAPTAVPIPGTIEPTAAPADAPPSAPPTPPITPPVFFPTFRSLTLVDLQFGHDAILPPITFEDLFAVGMTPINGVFLVFGTKIHSSYRHSDACL
ncbi:hypothetical protein UXO70_13475, partial [Enterobacter hormaechei]